MIDNSELLEHWTELFIGYLNGTLNEREAAEFEELARDPHFEAAPRTAHDQRLYRRPYGRIR